MIHCNIIHFYAASIDSIISFQTYFPSNDQYRERTFIKEKRFIICLCLCQFGHSVFGQLRFVVHVRVELNFPNPNRRFIPALPQKSRSYVQASASFRRALIPFLPCQELRLLFMKNFSPWSGPSSPSPRLDTAKRPVRHCARVEKSHKCTDTPTYAHIEMCFTSIYAENEMTDSCYDYGQQRNSKTTCEQ